MQNKGYRFKWPDLIRWAIHLPIGAIIAHMILCVNPVLGAFVAVYFLAYEALEDWRVHDRSFKDVFGSLIAMVVGGYAIWWWRL